MFWMQILYEIYALKNILPVGTLSFHTISTVFLKTNKQTNKQNLNVVYFTFNKIYPFKVLQLNDFFANLESLSITICQF